MYRKDKRSYVVDAYFLGKRFRKFFRREIEAKRFSEAVRLREKRMEDEQFAFLSDVTGMFET